MKDNSKLTTDFESEYDAQEIFIDACVVAITIVLIGMVLFAMV